MCLFLKIYINIVENALSPLTRAVEVPKKKAGKKAPATGAAGAF